MAKRSNLSLTLALFALGTVAAASASASMPADYRDEILPEISPAKLNP